MSQSLPQRSIDTPQSRPLKECGVSRYILVVSVFSYLITEMMKRCSNFPTPRVRQLDQSSVLLLLPEYQCERFAIWTLFRGFNIREYLISRTPNAITKKNIFDMWLSSAWRRSCAWSNGCMRSIVKWYRASVYCTEYQFRQLLSTSLA